MTSIDNLKVKNMLTKTLSFSVFYGEDSTGGYVATVPFCLAATHKAKPLRRPKST